MKSKKSKGGLPAVNEVIKSLDKFNVVQAKNKCYSK